MMILTAKHIAPTIDLRALRLCAPNNAPTANAMNAATTAIVKIMTFLCNTIFLNYIFYLIIIKIMILL